MGGVCSCLLNEISWEVRIGGSWFRIKNCSGLLSFLSFGDVHKEKVVLFLGV